MRLGRLAALGALALAVLGRAEAACDLQKVVAMPVQSDNNQLTLAGSLDGHPVRFLVDTALPRSLVLAPAAEQMGLPVTDSRESWVKAQNLGSSVGDTTVGQMVVGQLGLKNIRIMVIGQRPDLGAKDLVAVFGRDFLGQFDVEIDLDKNLLTFYAPQPAACKDTNLAYWSDKYNVVAMGKNDLLTAQVNGEQVNTVLDSGEPYSTLTTRAAQRVGVSRDADAKLAPEKLPTDVISLSYEMGIYKRTANVTQNGETQMGTEIRRIPDVWQGKFDSFALDQESIKGGSLRYQRFPEFKSTTGSFVDREGAAQELLLGVDFLRAHHVLVSYSQKKIYFSYAGGPAFQ
jgi:predicted aspartyl protease